MVVEAITSQVICLNKCQITDVFIYANGADATISLYDGENTKGVKKITLFAKDGYSNNISPSGDWIFERGCYVEVNATTTEVVIWYKNV